MAYVSEDMQVSNFGRIFRDMENTIHHRENLYLINECNKYLLSTWYVPSTIISKQNRIYMPSKNLYSIGESGEETHSK